MCSSDLERERERERERIFKYVGGRRYLRFQSVIGCDAERERERERIFKYVGGRRYLRFQSVIHFATKTCVPDGNPNIVRVLTNVF